MTVQFKKTISFLFVFSAIVYVGWNLYYFRNIRELTPYPMTEFGEDIKAAAG